MTGKEIYELQNKCNHNKLIEIGYKESTDCFGPCIILQNYCEDCGKQIDINFGIGSME